MNNWTQTQKLVFNGIISIFLTALIAALQAIVQKSSGNGSIDVASLINTGIVVFGASFSPAMIAYVPGHIQQELQALRDTVAELTHKSDPPPSVPPTGGSVIAPPPTK